MNDQTRPMATRKSEVKMKPVNTMNSTPIISALATLFGAAVHSVQRKLGGAK